MNTWIRGAIAAAVMSTTLASALPVRAAVDTFLTVDGIKGESLDSKHKGDIEILSWSWGTVSPRSVGTLAFTKVVDKASAGLLKASLSGEHIKKATLIVRKGGERPLEYIKIVLQDVLVSQVQVSFAGGDRAIESVTFSFSKVQFDYTGQKADGSGEPSGSVTWDANTNKP